MHPLDLEFLTECLKAQIISPEEFREAIEQDVVVYACDQSCIKGGAIKDEQKPRRNL